MTDDSVTDADLHAYVDDQLDANQRIRVERYLVQNSEAASLVFADMRARDMLRLAFGAQPADGPTIEMRNAARRLERALIWARISLHLRRTAAAVLFIGAGWFAHAQADLFELTDDRASLVTAAFIEDARQSHETVLVRERMASQRHIASYDPTEILTVTGITLPELPPDWRVIDVEIFPSRLGHSVEIAIKTDDFGYLSVFAARSPAPRALEPTLAHSPKSVTVYWQSGEFLYALTGAASGPALEKAAVRLHTSLHLSDELLRK